MRCSRYWLVGSSLRNLIDVLGRDINGFGGAGLASWALVS